VFSREGFPVDVWFSVCNGFILYIQQRGELPTSLAFRACRWDCRRICRASCLDVEEPLFAFLRCMWVNVFWKSFCRSARALRTRPDSNERAQDIAACGLVDGRLVVDGFAPHVAAPKKNLFGWDLAARFFFVIFIFFFSCERIFLSGGGGTLSSSFPPCLLFCSPRRPAGRVPFSEVHRSIGEGLVRALQRVPRPGQEQGAPQVDLFCSLEGAGASLYVSYVPVFVLVFGCERGPF